MSLSQYWLKDRSSFLATRFLSPPSFHRLIVRTTYRCLLGALQGGFIPDVILYLSYFYTKNELPIRLAWFWVSNLMAQLIGAFIATGILKLRGVHGVAGWRYLFLIEGILTAFAGVLSFFLMPPGPTQTKAWWRPTGWFDERCVCDRYQL